jgi:hypothetical protein
MSGCGVYVIVLIIHRIAQIVQTGTKDAKTTSNAAFLRVFAPNIDLDTEI